MLSRDGSSCDDTGSLAHREVLEFGGGVVVYPPLGVGGYWRVRWVEGGRRRERSATSREVALARASGVGERLGLGVPSDLGSASEAALVAHYLTPGRRPARGRRWSARHREEQESYCRRFVLPVIATVAVSGLTRAHFQRMVHRAASASVAEHLRRCLSALVAAGLEEGLLLARQDVLRGVHWSGPATPAAGPGPGFFDDDDDDEGSRLVEAALIPTGAAVEALADAAVERSGVWWRQLQLLLVAYSGMR